MIADLKGHDAAFNSTETRAKVKVAVPVEPYLFCGSIRQRAWIKAPADDAKQLIRQGLEKTVLEHTVHANKQADNDQETQ